ncbi:hypothetical protein AnigIFM50267_006446 [Aspergillus niger]|nr:hypothetical protein AnigIFM50267_006446 [Aspergillus niger]
MFGLKPPQIQEAGEILQQIARDWRELIAGSEGYLTDETRRGLFQQSVAWGEMPMTYPDKVTVYHKLVHDPTSPDAPRHGFYLHAMIVSEARQRPAARVSEDLVMYDYKAIKKAELPPFVMEQFKSTWDLQEQAKKYWQERILDIETRVRTLETESWDREDAVEDTGSAKQ